MKCLECGADLLDSATFCPRCGTPTSTTTSFSYLPAGAPPWPATVPQGTSSTATAVKDPAQAATSVRSVADAKPRRSVGSIFAALLLLILSVVIGVGATLAILTATGSLGFTTTAPRQIIHPPTPTPTTSAAATGTTTTGTPAASPTAGTQRNLLPLPGSFIVVKIAEVGVSMKYPSNWIKDQPQISPNYTFINIHPQQQIGLGFGIQRFSATASAQIKSVDDLNQNILQPGPNDSFIHNYKQIQPANPAPTIGDIQWAEQDATFTNNQGILFHNVSISVRHNNLYYNINYLAPDVVYAEAMQKYYAEMLSSFQFLP